MRSLFRSRAPEPVDPAEPDEPVEAYEADESVDETEDGAEPARPRGYTPSKKELGRATPKRPAARVRRPGAAPAPGSRKHLTKEEKQEVKEQRRARRREVTEGMKRGDERFLTARDRGPERALARDVVDSRRTAGTWFFAGALLVLLGSGTAMPAQVRTIATVLWSVIALAVIVDCTLLCRRTKRLVAERVPDPGVRMGSLYFYVVMRSVTFRRLRIPQPRLKFGDRV